MSVQWPGSKGKPLTFPRETITENLQERPYLIWWVGKLRIHTEVWEVLVFQIKMSLHGRTQGGSWCYQRIQAFYHLSVGRDCSAYCRWLFFFMLLLFCNSILQNSCWSDFSWDGVVARARTLHLPSSTLLPATCVAFAPCWLSGIQTHWKFLLISSAPNQAFMLYHCPLKS